MSSSERLLRRHLPPRPLPRHRCGAPPPLPLLLLRLFLRRVPRRRAAISPWDLPFDFSNTQRQLISGGVAGCVAKTLTAPLSRLTILFQVHSMVTTKPHAPAFSDGMISGLRKIVGKEGVLSFWKGNMTSVVHRFPYSAINFHAYESVMRLLEDQTNKAQQAAGPSSSPSAQPTTGMMRFAAGATAGGIATASCYPLDLVRTRLTTQLGQPNSSSVYYRGILLYRIVADELLSSTRASVTLLVGRTSPSPTPCTASCATWLCSANPNPNATSSSIEQQQPPPGRDKTKVVLVNTASGALSGVSSTLVIYPLDVLRRRMQLQGLHRTAGQRTGVAYEVMTILQAEGVRGMYRGLTPELCKIVPMVGCTFCVYEAMRDVLQVER